MHVVTGDMVVANASCKHKKRSSPIAQILENVERFAYQRFMGRSSGTQGRSLRQKADSYLFCFIITWRRRFLLRPSPEAPRRKTYENAFALTCVDGDFRLFGIGMVFENGWW